eukprot:2201530-Amphidinium_carterae.3
MPTVDDNNRRAAEKPKPRHKYEEAMNYNMSFKYTLTKPTKAEPNKFVQTLFFASARRQQLNRCPEAPPQGACPEAQPLPLDAAELFPLRHLAAVGSSFA